MEGCDVASFFWLLLGYVFVSFWCFSCVCMLLGKCLGRERSQGVSSIPLRHLKRSSEYFPVWKQKRSYSNLSYIYTKLGFGSSNRDFNDLS